MFIRRLVNLKYSTSFNKEAKVLKRKMGLQIGDIVPRKAISFEELKGKVSWEELKVIRKYTINFNPAVEYEIITEESSAKNED